MNDHDASPLARPLGATGAASIGRETRIWYPLPPRGVPLLRVIGVLYGGFVVYSAWQHPPGSGPVWLRLGPSVLIVLYWLSVRPELRPATLLHRVGLIAHWLLVALVLPLALATLVGHFLTR